MASALTGASRLIVSLPRQDGREEQDRQGVARIGEASAVSDI